MREPKKQKRIKSVAKNSGRIKVEDEPNYEDMPPIFSLERVQNCKYCFSKLKLEDQAAFATAMFRRRETTWKSIKQTHRHGIGFEKIPKNVIKAGIPPFITHEMNDFIAFRFSGKKPMVGYRQKNIFYVLWFDLDFTLYKH